MFVVAGSIQIDIVCFVEIDHKIYFISAVVVASFDFKSDNGCDLFPQYPMQQKQSSLHKDLVKSLMEAPLYSLPLLNFPYNIITLNL